MSFHIKVGTHVPELKPHRTMEDRFCQPIVDAVIVGVNEAHRHFMVEFRFKSGQSYRQSFQYLPDDK